MPKKFQGENSKSSVARARKEALRQAEIEKKEKEAEDAFWQDDDKHVQRKQQRKEEKEKRKHETAERKATNKQMLEAEMDTLKLMKVAAPPTKLTRAQIASGQEQQSVEAERRTSVEEEIPLEENVNRLQVDGLEARNIEEAISILTDQSQAIDLHPERRVKAAYAAFEEENLPRLKAENPNLRLSQLKQILKKDWMKSPQNPLVFGGQ